MTPIYAGSVLAILTLGIVWDRSREPWFADRALLFALHLTFGTATCCALHTVLSWSR